MIGRHEELKRRYVRKFISLSLLSCLCASFLPAPTVRQPSDQKDASQPYPCQDRPCGCNSAAQCWKQCCCFTNAEKVVWARKNGVKLPSFVAAAAKSEATAKTSKKASASKPKCAACHPKLAKSKQKSCYDGAADSFGDAAGENHTVADTHTVAAATTGSSCCLSGGDQEHKSEEHCGNRTCDPDSDIPTEISVSKKTRYVIGIQAMKCRGQGIFWNVLPWAVVPGIPLLDLHVGPERWDSPQSIVAQSAMADPPEPPPRLA